MNALCGGLLLVETGGCHNHVLGVHSSFHPFLLSSIQHAFTPARAPALVPTSNLVLFSGEQLNFKQEVFG